MNALRDLIRNSALILVAVALVACGGGGSGDKDGDTGGAGTGGAGTGGAGTGGAGTGGAGTGGAGTGGAGTGGAGTGGAGAGGADTSDAQGLYSGTADGGLDVVGLVLDNGHYYFLYGSLVSERVDGVVHGRDGKAANGSFTSSNAVNYALDEDEVLSASINASYTPGATLKGTITYSDETASFDLTYDDDYDQPAEMPVGRIQGTATSESGDDEVYFDVTSGGTFSGQSKDFACNFSGTLAARGSKNAFDLRVTFASGAAGADCDFPGQLLDGVAYFDVEGGVFYAAAPTSDRKSGFLFVGGFQQL